MVILEQLLFLGLNPLAFLLFLLILELDFIERTLCLSVACPLSGKLGGNPLVFPLAVNIQIQYGVVVAVLLLQTTCYHDNPPFVITSAVLPAIDTAQPFSNCNILSGEKPHDFSTQVGRHIQIIRKY